MNDNEQSVARGQRSVTPRSPRMAARAIPFLPLLLGVTFLLALYVSPALAQKGAVSFFGGKGTKGGEFTYPQALEINQDGTGGSSPGDVYVLDGNRIQQFSAGGVFIRAFGLDVGGPGVDICEDAPSCQQGTASGAAGAIGRSIGLEGRSIDLAIDQATGAIYITDEGNHRIDIFSAAGAFEGSFGWAVKASEPVQELQFCTIETGCQTGSYGSGAGQFRGGAPIADSITRSSHDHLAVSPLNGRIVVGDAGNRRIDEFVPKVEGGKVTGISFLRGYGWGAANGADEFQVCTSSCHIPPEGGGPQAGHFGPWYPSGIAVDATGKIYATDRFTTLNSDVPRFQTFGPEGDPLGIVGEHSRLYEDLRINHTTGRLIAKDVSALDELNPEGVVVNKYFSGGEIIGQTGVAQNEATGTTYSGIIHPDVGIVTLGEVVPPTVSISPVATHAGTTATFEGHVNPNGLFAEYRFEYSPDGVHWTVVENHNGVLPPDNTEHLVTQEVSGLEALTQYQVRLTATKIFKSGTGEAETAFETSAAPPDVSEMPTASAISQDDARLEAKINPENQLTQYHFECVDNEEFARNEYSNPTKVPLDDGEVKAAGEKIEVEQQITGLAPATGYHCRLLASNPAGESTSPDFTFVTYQTQLEGLPDNRRYEQVTPVGKNGADANGEEFLSKASPVGDAVTYVITGGGGASDGGGQEFPTYVAYRGNEAWSERPLLPSSTYGERASVKGWSEDLRRDYVLMWESGTRSIFYEQDVATGRLREIAGGLAPSSGAFFAGESSSGTRVLFESKSALLPEAIEGVWNLYAWDNQAGSLSLVSVLPDGSSPLGGAFAGPYDWAELMPKGGGASSEAYTQKMHVFSSDGTKAFFTTGNVNQVYVRKGIGTPSEGTSQISASQKTNGTGPEGRDPKGPKKAAFMTATPDGSFAFFTSPEELTNDATTGTADQGNDLYRYDVESGGLIDLVPDSVDANGAEVQGVLGTSADGSYVYFVANGVLAGGSSPGTCKSNPIVGWTNETGTCNLYLWHEGQVTFVSRIGGTVETGLINWTDIAVVGSNVRPMNSAHVSLDGHTLSFTTSLSLTPYDNRGLLELYHYNTDKGLACVSCSPTQAEAKTPVSLQAATPGFTKPSNPNFFQIRSQSADGNRLFFETQEKLVADDVNGDNGCSHRSCLDVYEWEAMGSGSCQSEAQNGGCLYLISTGQSSSPSYFVDASSNGDNVFFLTRQSLVRQDGDALVDVYDARVNGGLPSQNQPTPTPCEGDRCKPDIAAPQSPFSAGTASFSGPENPKVARKKSTRHKKHGKHGRKNGKPGKKKARHHESKSRSKR